MKDIPVADLLRADLMELKRELARSDAAREELRGALDHSAEHIAMLSAVLATVIHRQDEAGITITDDERVAACEACWLRITVDIIEHDDARNSVRISLVPPTADEREMNAVAIKDKKAALAENVDDKPPKFEG